MNNLLKLLLIIPLFSSTASSVNNSSLPLPDIELKMGQNSSELVKRDKLITLYGGIDVIGFTPLGRELCQRSCTLSFPVSFNNDKGFLTSFDCAYSSVFVGETLVGHVSGAYNYKPELGLEYVFVSVYDDYWYNSISKNVAFTEYLIESNDTKVLPMTSSTQPPFVNLPVCAYGGKSRLACGEIVEFGVTITMYVPGSCRKERAQFNNVVKVAMNKDYQSSDLGAPVYIPAQIPFSKQLIVAPVGQVVEEYNWDSKTSGQNIWYYIPIDRILQDSGLKLLLGDFSVNGKNSSISTNSSEEVSIDSKSSNSKLQERQNIYPTLHCGDKIKLRMSRIQSRVRTCTLGFAIKRHGGGRGILNFEEGYLTLASCFSSRYPADNSGSYSPYDVLAETGRRTPTEVIVGSGSNSVRSAGYNPTEGLDYAILRVTSPQAWNNGESMSITSHDPNHSPLIKTLNPITPTNGMPVCFSGSYSGLVCGEYLQIAADLSRSNPWVAYLTQMDYFLRVRIVALSAPSYNPLSNNRFEDYGAPVFVPVYEDCDPTKQIIAAHPVGLLIHQSISPIVVTEVVYLQPRFRAVPFSFYYQPLELILNEARGVELITTPNDLQQPSCF